MQRVIPDYSKADLSTLLPLQMQLTWASGLLALATDVAAGLAHLHGLQLYPGRLFPCNVCARQASRHLLTNHLLPSYGLSSSSRAM